jgi:hypothetical protein
VDRGWRSYALDAASFDVNYDPYGTNTGLVKFGQRWYDPYWGSWSQQDSLDSP